MQGKPAPATAPPTTATRTPLPTVPPTAPPAFPTRPAARPGAVAPEALPPPPAAPAEDPDGSWKAVLTPFLQRAVPESPSPSPPQVPLARSSESVRVGLLLPLSGPNARLGEAMLDAAMLAVFAFGDDRLELLPHDTEAGPDGAAQAAQLAVSDGASLVLGPLLASSVRAVAPAARAANVPVIAFSSDRTVAGNGVYVMGFLPQAEVERVATFARTRGVQRFAALAPNNAYGNAVVRALRTAVEKQGSSVTRVQTYDPAVQDFTDSVRALADYDRRRGALLSHRKELEARDDELAKRALQRLERLQTLGELPFDALLIAEEGKKLQSIAALLPFYDIDPAKIRILGTGQWDEPGIGAEPALVGSWFAAPPPTARAAFEQEYQNVFKQQPPRLATLAYDAVALAAVLARTEGGPDFSHKAIMNPNGFWGRDGIFRFLPEGIAERGLAVLRVLPRGAAVVGEAPESFQAATN